MKTAFTPTRDLKLSIMQRILDGSLTIDSLEELKDVMHIYPEDPFLHRMHADLLKKLNRPEEAVEAYEIAANFFIDRGLNLQAVVAKILQWSIQKVGHDEGRSFHARLHEEGSVQTPLQRFWARMSYPELVAIMRRLVRVRLPAGNKVTQVDEPAEELFFVVLGTLYEMPSPECLREAEIAGIDVEPVLLGPNDVFGDVFPLDQETFAGTEIRSVTEVELIKIAKPVLRSVCRKYPRIEFVLKEIGKPENRENCDRPWQTVRRGMRFGLPTKAVITCPAMTPNQKSWRHTGIAADLSIGGMCLDLADAPIPTPKTGLKGRLVQIKLDLLNEVAVLNITGKVAWQNRRKRQTGSDTLIGIRFDTLSPMDRDMLAEYCSGSVGEQNLLLSLWDTMVKTDDGE